MFVGHLAAGLALKKAEPRINLGILFFASLLADFLLGLFVLFGIEQVHVPANFADIHYLMFTFPYSHGLLASVLWSLLGFGVVQLLWRTKGAQKWRVGLVIALAVFSHFLLDWIVHAPELPLLGETSPKLGLGLWNHLGLALTLETGLVFVGLALYFQAVKPSRRVTQVGLVLLMLLVTIATVAGQAFSNTPPPPTGAALSWIIQPLLLGGVAYWLDQRPHTAQ
ncbi:MAG: hypothetical protein U0350_01395 [Caldilineaceae bacterium]